MFILMAVNWLVSENVTEILCAYIDFFGAPERNFIKLVKFWGLSVTLTLHSDTQTLN